MIEKDRIFTLPLRNRNHLKTKFRPCDILLFTLPLRNRNHHLSVLIDLPVGLFTLPLRNRNFIHTCQIYINATSFYLTITESKRGYYGKFDKKLIVFTLPLRNRNQYMYV